MADSLGAVGSELCNVFARVSAFFTVSGLPQSKKAMAAFSLVSWPVWVPCPMFSWTPRTFLELCKSVELCGSKKGAEGVSLMCISISDN
jgi:hypothetical protein